ncbi:conserved hypothetical protein [metagenome]|uniref:Uncharacterized protein n=1 Tax=metagenome TaxID=256318 RepID=A0A2P2BY43_9ZZZZ
MVNLSEHVEHCRVRFMQDALSEATAVYWRRRAAQFEWARPKPGEHHGQATPQQLRERDERLRDEAEACRNRARVALLGGEVW